MSSHAHEGSLAEQSAEPAVQVNPVDGGDIHLQLAGVAGRHAEPGTRGRERGFGLSLDDQRLDEAVRSVHPHCRAGDELGGLAILRQGCRSTITQPRRDRCSC
jgi:hypothetical protein